MQECFENNNFIVKCTFLNLIISKFHHSRILMVPWSDKRSISRSLILHFVVTETSFKRCRLSVFPLVISRKFSRGIYGIYKLEILWSILLSGGQWNLLTPLSHYKGLPYPSKTEFKINGFRLNQQKFL